jgi:hypothetical protein
MLLADETAQLDEVAAALGRTPEWLRRHWLKLHLDEGFPRKHPSGWTWPRAAVAAWLRAPGAPALPVNDNRAGEPDPWEAALNERYGG